MSNSVEKIKALVGKGRGFARPNLYRIILPSVVGDTRFKLPVVGELLNRGQANIRRTIEPEDINMLCSAVGMPGRQLNTHDRRIGLINQKVAYGFTVEDVNLTFRVLNDFKIKEYFEAWQNSAIKTNYEIAYFNDYTADVVIQSITNNPSGDYDQLLKLSYAGLDAGGIETALAGGQAVAYTCLLQNAYPTNINTMEFSDGNADGLLELQVTLSYKDWKRRPSNREDVRDMIRSNIVDFALGKFKEKGNDFANKLFG